MSLTTTAPVVLQHGSKLPEITRSLAMHVHDPDPQPWRLPTRLDVTEAQRVLVTVDAMSAPGRCDDPAWQREVMAWLRLLAGHARNAPQPAELVKVLPGVLLACADLPRSVWTIETSAEALRRFDWWPSTAVLHDLLAERAKPLLDMKAGLRRVSGASPPVPISDPESEVADRLRSRERVAELVRQAKANLCPSGDA